jgi:hypothetical protein
MTQPPFGQQPSYGDDSGQQQSGGYGYGGPGYGAPYGQPGYGAPGYGPGGYPYAPPPDNYLVWSILVTVFCCLPLGIVSIIKASQVNSLWAQGQQGSAYEAAAAAKKWAIWGAIIGPIVSLLFIVLYFVVIIGIFAASSSTAVYY